MSIETTINEYITAQVKRLAGESNLYHSLEIEAWIQNGNVTMHHQAYAEHAGHFKAPTLADAVDNLIASIDRRTESQIKRDTAAKLMAEADALDLAESLKNQPALL